MSETGAGPQPSDDSAADGPRRWSSRTENAPRDCGGCNACCTAMRVTALGKPAGTPCPHQNEHGCGIYPDRPSTCRQWFCMWVRDDKGLFAEHHRPDKLGVFFTASRPSGQTGQQRLYAHEIRPNAAAENDADRVIQYLRRFVAVEIIPYRAPSQPTLTIHGRAV